MKGYIDTREAAILEKVTRQQIARRCKGHDGETVSFPILGNMLIKKINGFWKLQYPDKYPDAQYSRSRDNMNTYAKLKYAAQKDIGAIPECVNPQRRKKCSNDLGLFLKTYLSETYDLPWSGDHIKAIAKIQNCILNGGLFALAMPRGSGKTSIIEGACLFATLYGYRRYIVPISASTPAADLILQSIKVELEANELLLEDFPEVCFPFFKLQGISLRAKGQTYNKGTRTYIDYKTDKLIYPTIHGSLASGSVIESKGITSNYRGLKHKCPNGEVIRPDLVLLDDCQTDESAISITQCNKRENLINSAVLGLAGQRKQIAGFMLCTIICINDLSDRILDHQRNPHWQGETFRLVYNFPDTQDTLWKEYAKLRQEGILSGDNGEQANNFYEQNQEEMDAGAIVSWESRKYPNEISALQHAENLLIERGEAAFYSEFQNEPLDIGIHSIYNLNEELICSRVNHQPRGTQPSQTHFLVVGIDINFYGLNWVCTAFENDMTGYVIDYGKYPEGKQVLWNPKDDNTMSQQQTIYTGVEELCKKLSAKYQLSGILVDCGFETKVVFKVVQYLNSLLPTTVLCSRGWSSKSYKQTNLVGQPGNNWHKTKWTNYNANVIIHNGDYWKCYVQKAFLLSPAAPGSISLYGNDQTNHILIAEHICSEILQEVVKGKTGLFYKWNMRVGYKNDLLDALIISTVAGGVAGASIIKQQPAIKQKKQRKQKGKVSYTTL